MSCDATGIRDDPRSGTACNRRYPGHMHERRTKPAHRGHLGRGVQSSLAGHGSVAPTETRRMRAGERHRLVGGRATGPWGSARRSGKAGRGNGVQDASSVLTRSSGEIELCHRVDGVVVDRHAPIVEERDRHAVDKTARRIDTNHLHGDAVRCTHRTTAEPCRERATR